MKRIIYILILLLIAVNCLSIESIQGGGWSVFEDSRNAGQELNYHTNTQDLMFYGSNRWAVNFIINRMINKTDPDTFLVNSVKIYSASTISNVGIRIFNNRSALVNGVNVNHPDTTVVLHPTIRMDFTTGWNTIDFSTPVQVSNSWIVTEFATSKDGPYMVASHGTGANSYYYDSHGHSLDYKYMFSMQSAGFNADFLFTLVGNFKNQTILLEIMNFLNPNNLLPNELYIPNFTFKNNSMVPVRNVFMKLNRITGVIDTLGSVSDVLVFADSLDITRGNPISAGMELHSGSTAIHVPGFDLLQNFAQYNIELILGAERNEHTVVGRTVRGMLNVFENEKEKTMIEVFANSQTDNNQIRYLLTETNTENTDIIFYFTNIIDNHHTLAANQRRTLYNHQGDGHIYLNGDIRNNYNLETDFENSFLANYNYSLTDRTFITTEKDTRIYFKDHSLHIDVALENLNTILLNSVHNNLRIFAAFVQPVRVQDQTIMLLSQFISTPTGSPVTLQYERRSGFSWHVAPHNIVYMSNNSDISDLSVLVWVQDRNQKKIYYHNIYPLNNIELSSADENIAVLKPDVRLYPNPISSKSRMNMEFSNSMEQKDIKVSVFNIKGQKIATHSVAERSFAVESLNIKHNGIYFMKVEWVEG